MPNVDCDLPVMGPTPPDEVSTSRSMQGMMDDPTLVLTGTEPPVVSDFSPALAAAITSTTKLSFTVQPVSPATLQRVVIMVSFPILNIYEVAHDWDALTQNYPDSLGNVRTAVGDGFSYTLLRKSGWPASPRFIPMAVDEFGNMNPISSVIYAWTLVE